MSDDVVEPLTLAALPIPENRDAAWKLLRERGSLFALDNGLVATDRAVIEAVFKQPGLFSSKQAFDILASPLPLVPIAFDPPDHTRYRHILQPFFSPRSIRPLEPRLREQLAALLDPMTERDGCDFVAEVAGVFPTQVFLTLFGLPLDKRDQLIDWKDAVLGLSDASGTIVPEASAEGTQKAAELFGYLVGLVGQRRGVPGDDILSALLGLDGDQALTDEEVIGLCFLFVLAGLDTVTDSLGFGMERLARNPAQRAEIVRDPTLIPNAVEELVRLDPPAPFVPRITTQDTVLDGLPVPAGTRVTSYLAAANRDQTGYPDPYAVNFHRPDNAHASFGLGAHRCLGSHLARLEMRLVYEEWHKRFPDYRIAPGQTPRVTWPRGTIGLESLHLLFAQDDAS